jgi:hypothetical protein
MDSDQALDTVGLPHPGGDPTAIGANAQAWQSLAAFLQQHGEELTRLSVIPGESWSGADADTFRSQLRGVAQNASSAAETVSAVGTQQQQDADTHKLVLEILKEVGIQLAVMLAFWAAGWVFPPLVAASEAYLSTLIVQGSRALELFVRALSAIVRTLVETRNWIESAMQLTWRTDLISIGYGRMLTEGIRDFGIDLTAGTVASEVQGKPIDPLQLIKNALVGGSVGAVLGGLERSGITKLLDETGAVRRSADGKPIFTSFGDQAKSAVNSVGRPAIGGEVSGARFAIGPKARTESLFDDLATAQATARMLEVDRSRSGLAGLEEELATSRAAHADALDALDALTSAENQANSADLDDLTALFNHQSSVIEATDTAIEVEARITRLQRQLGAWHALDGARRSIRDNTSLGEQLVNAWQRNPWQHGFPTAHELTHGVGTLPRVNSWQTLTSAIGPAEVRLKGFGSPKSWQTTWLYDTPRYFVKGFASNAVKTYFDTLMGKATPDDIWKTALLGASFSSVRGALNATMGNVVWPQYGIEETLSKAGLKALDNLVLSEIRTHVLNPSTANPAPSNQPATGEAGHAWQSGLDAQSGQSGQKNEGRMATS